MCSGGTGVPPVNAGGAPALHRSRNGGRSPPYLMMTSFPICVPSLESTRQM